MIGRLLRLFSNNVDRVTAFTRIRRVRAGFDVALAATDAAQHDRQDEDREEAAARDQRVEGTRVALVIDADACFIWRGGRGGLRAPRLASLHLAPETSVVP